MGCQRLLQIDVLWQSRIGRGCEDPRIGNMKPSNSTSDSDLVKKWAKTTA